MSSDNGQTSGGWFKLDNAAAERSYEIGRAFQVYAAIVRHADEKRRAWPGIDRLSKMTGLSPRSVRYAIERLESAGWILVDRQPGRPNTYTLPPIEKKATSCPTPETSKAMGCQGVRQPVAAGKAMGCPGGCNQFRRRRPIEEDQSKRPIEEDQGARQGRGRGGDTGGIESDAFQAAWSRWLAYRKNRLTCTPETLQGQLKSLATIGVVDAIAEIDNSIKNGWQSVCYKPGANGNGRASAVRRRATESRRRSHRTRCSLREQTTSQTLPLVKRPCRPRFEPTRNGSGSSTKPSAGHSSSGRRWRGEKTSSLNSDRGTLIVASIIRGHFSQAAEGGRRAPRLWQKVPDHFHKGEGVILSGCREPVRTIWPRRWQSAFTTFTHFRQRAYFRFKTGLDLYQDVRDTMKGKGDREWEVVQPLIDASLLILSDPLPPRGPLTDFQAGVLLQDHRRPLSVAVSNHRDVEHCERARRVTNAWSADDGQVERWFALLVLQLAITPKGTAMTELPPDEPGDCGAGDT